LSVRRALGVASASAASAATLAACADRLARFAREREGARSLEDALAGSTGLWHALAIEAPLRTLAPLVATVLALRLVTAPLARLGALVGAIAGLAAFAVNAALHPAPHGVFAGVVAATFGAAIGACASEVQRHPKAGSPLIFAWITSTFAAAALLTSQSARGRAAVLLAAVLTASVTAAHALLQRKRRRLRDDVGATISLASRTLQSIAPWRLRGDALDHVSLRWVAFGVLTTLGLLVTACAGAVVAGRALGLDFATFEQEAGASSADLAFVAAFVLAAFALAGWLLGRASAVRATSESILGPLLVIPIVVVALPTGRSGFLLTIVFALVAALFTAAGAVMARSASA
jgi:hypothetical protein